MSATLTRCEHTLEGINSFQSCEDPVILAGALCCECQGTRSVLHPTELFTMPVHRYVILVEMGRGNARAGIRQDYITKTTG